MKILITGTAGFIGFHLAAKLLERGDVVVGLDNINDYYDQRVKYARLAETGISKTEIEYGKLVSSSKFANYSFIKINLEDKENLEKLFEMESFDAVCHLAAQAGVRYSIQNPQAYIDSNIIGFINILEACRHYNVQNLSYASSSSVYGLNEKYPFSTTDSVDHPISLYAASKKSNELMAHVYSHLYGIRTTGLRFFTVYGPWGRPDMALYKFVKAAFDNKPIEVYNNGEMSRDFTYIDDIVTGVILVIDNPAKHDTSWTGEAPASASSSAPYKIYNIGNNQPVKLTEFIEAIERSLGKPIQKTIMPLQPGDVLTTYADVNDLMTDFNYKPCTDIQGGVDAFVNWYIKFNTN